MEHGRRDSSVEVSVRVLRELCLCHFVSCTTLIIVLSTSQFLLAGISHFAAVQGEHHGLRRALKILSKSEKQLRVSTDPATWLTAALLQFAPDRSLPPSDFNMNVAPNRVVTASSSDVSVSGEQHPLVDELNQANSPESTSKGRALQVYVENGKDPTLEVETATSLSEQKLEETWATVQRTSLGSVEELTEARPSPEAFLEYQIFGDKELDELWKRAIRKITNRSLKHLLQIHGQLVAAGISVGRHSFILCSRVSCGSCFCGINSVMFGILIREFAS